MYLLPDISFLVIFFLTFYNPFLKKFFFNVNLIRTKRIYLTLEDFWYLEEKKKSGIKLSFKEETMIMKGYYSKEVSNNEKEETDFEFELNGVLALFIGVNISSIFWIPLASKTLGLLINNSFKYWFFVLIMLFLTLIISLYSIRWLFIRIKLLYNHAMYFPSIRHQIFPRFDFRKWELCKKDKYRLKNEMVLSIASVLGLLYILKNIFLIIIVFFL